MGKTTRCVALYSESPNGPAESETLNMRGRSIHENREISALPVRSNGGSVREGRGCNPDMYGAEKSDSLIVPMKFSNNGCGAPLPAERVEARELTKGNLFS